MKYKRKLWGQETLLEPSEVGSRWFPDVRVQIPHFQLREGNAKEIDGNPGPRSFGCQGLQVPSAKNQKTAWLSISILRWLVASKMFVPGKINAIWLFKIAMENHHF